MLGKIRDLLNIPSGYNIRSVEDIEVLISKVKSLRDRYSEFVNLMKEYERLSNEFKNEYYEELISRRSKLEASVESLEKEYENTLIEINNIKHEINDLKMQIELINEFNKVSEELHNFEYELKLWKYLNNYVFKDSRFPLTIIKRIVEDRLNYYVNSILSKIAPNIMVRMSVSESGKGISMDIYIDNIRREAITLSGGEKTLVGFAVRLGISQLVSDLHGGVKPDFLIIDEGFGPLDEYNRDEIAHILSSLVSSGIYTQLIIISHESSLRDNPVFKSIVRVEKKDGLSRIYV